MNTAFTAIGMRQDAPIPQSQPLDFGIRRRMDFAAVLRGQQQNEAALARVAADKDPLPRSAVLDQRPASSEPVSPAGVVRARTGGVPSPPAAPPGAPGTPASPEGFERSLDSRLPYLPRFKTVPEWARHPLGPYRQAPPDYGGDWWQVNPFTGSEPWKRLTAEFPSESLPEGFEQVFGPRPKSSDRAARARWDTELKYFRGVGTPEGTDEAQLEAATREFEEWGLGRPVFFQDRYGWRVRFPDSEIPAFGGSPKTAVQAPHILIAHYQIRLLQQDITPTRLHPWLPAQLRPT